MEIAAFLIILVFFSLLLIAAADMVVVALRKVSEETHTGIFAISAVILAISTSFPELFVGITAALEHSPGVSLGDVMGANIANLALIGGAASLFYGRVVIKGEYLRKDVWMSMIAGLLPFFFLIDGMLSRVDGLILIVIYLAYATSVFNKRYEEIAREQRNKNDGFIYKFIRRFDFVNDVGKKELARFFIGIALLLFSADAIVRTAVGVAGRVGIPEFVIGLFAVAIGTTLPELAFSFRSLKDHEPGMFFGNILGSIIANSTLIVGVVATISPFQLTSVKHFSIATISFVIVFLCFWVFVRSKHRLERWEALILILLYIAFGVAEFLAR